MEAIGLKRFLLVFTLFLWVSSNCFGQTFNWADRIGSGGNNYVFDVVVDQTTGDIYATGRVKSLSTFGENTNPMTPTDHGDRDMYITKHNSSGDLVWVKRYGGLYTEYGLTVELDDDHVYIGGHYADTAYFEDDTLVSTGGQDIVLVKLSKDGDFIWTKVWGGPTGNDLITESHFYNNALYMVGIFEDTIDFDGIVLQNDIPLSYPSRETSFLIKCDTAGNVIWAEKQESTRGVRPIDIRVMDDQIYMVGNCYGNSYFGGQVFVSSNTVFYDQFFSKYTANGNHLHTSLYGDLYSDTFTNIEVTDRNSLVVCGFFAGDVTYGSDTYATSGIQTGVLVEIDTAGNIVNSFAALSADSGELDAVAFRNGHTYTGGYYYDTVFVANDTLAAPGTGLEMMYFELDANFQPIDYFNFGTTNHEHIRDLATSPTGEVILAGDFRGTLDFGSVIFTAAAATYDGFIAPYCPPIFKDAFVLDSTICLNEPLIIYDYTHGVTTSVPNLPVGGTFDFVDPDSLGILFGNPGVQSIEIHFSNGCSQDSIEFMNINVLDIPTLDLGPDIIACDTEVVVINAIGVYDSIYWTTGDSQIDSIVVSSSGPYQATVWNADGCSFTDGLMVTFDPCLSIPAEGSLWLTDIWYADNSIYFTLENPLDILTYSIFDYSGRLIQQGTANDQSIQLLNILNSGMYLIEFKSHDRREVAKFFVP